MSYVKYCWLKFLVYDFANIMSPCTDRLFLQYKVQYIWTLIWTGQRLVRSIKWGGSGCPSLPYSFDLDACTHSNRQSSFGSRDVVQSNFRLHSNALTSGGNTRRERSTRQPCLSALALFVSPSFYKLISLSLSRLTGLCCSKTQTGYVSCSL